MVWGLKIFWTDRLAAADVWTQAPTVCAQPGQVNVNEEEEARPLVPIILTFIL